MILWLTILWSSHSRRPEEYLATRCINKNPASFLARSIECYGQRYSVSSFWSSSVHSKYEIFVGPLDSFVTPNICRAILDCKPRGLNSRSLWNKKKRTVNQNNINKPLMIHSQEWCKRLLSVHFSCLTLLWRWVNNFVWLNYLYVKHGRGGRNVESCFTS